MRQSFTLFLSLIPFVIFGQSEKYDQILKIENLTFQNNEIRIYKDYSTSTGLEMFRFYNENGKWEAEFYETVASKNNAKTTIRVRKSKLNSPKNFELIWLEILNTDVLHLPKWESFKYKLRDKQFKYEIIEGKFFQSHTQLLVGDGVSYYVKVSANNRKNEFFYSNPDSYLTEYPNVDELISFKELLDLVTKEFKIFTNK